MAADEKDTIYIDLDDEITAIIDKLRGSDKKIVALVLPKRAAVLQSIVNMKLLKRAADQDNKNVVLITTESGLLPLAGAVGLHVAKTPTSRPEIPAAPGMPSDTEEQVNEDDPLIAQTAGNMPIGVLADEAAAEEGDAVPVRKNELLTDDAASRKAETMPLPPAQSAIPAAGAAAAGIETVEFDNAAKEPEASAATKAGVAAKAPKPKKDKKLHVPNFEKFRLIAILGAVVIVLLVLGGIWAFAIAPHATINVKTDASQINTNVNFELDTTADSLSGSTVPAKQVQVQKTFTGNAQATGQQNNGDKAAGSVVLSISCSYVQDNDTFPSVPAATPLTSDSNLTYITQQSISKSSWKPSTGGCTYTTTVKVAAQAGGANYNTNGSTDFTLPKSSSYDASSISGSGSASGGTDDIQTVVSQTDIENAQKNINANGGTQQSDLQNQLQSAGLYPITATYNAGTPNVTSSAQVGDQASSVTVTEVITYTMLGASKSDLKTLVDQNIKSQITGDQGILDEGITQAAFKMVNTTANGASMNLQTTAEVGPSIDVAQVAQNAAGQKSKDIEAQLQNNPDVTSVSVKLSPFWVTSAPKNVKKITVNIAKPTASND